MDDDRQAPRVRTTSISSMSQLLLAGWAMLADSCPECGVSSAWAGELWSRGGALAACTRTQDILRCCSDFQIDPACTSGKLTQLLHAPPAAGAADALARRHPASVHQLRARHC